MISRKGTIGVNLPVAGNMMNLRDDHFFLLPPPDEKGDLDGVGEEGRLG